MSIGASCYKVTPGSTSLFWDVAKVIIWPLFVHTKRSGDWKITLPLWYLQTFHTTLIKTRKKANKIIDSMDEERKKDVNAIFNIISFISWRSVVSEEVELPWENHWHAAIINIPAVYHINVYILSMKRNVRTH